MEFKVGQLVRIKSKSIRYDKNKGIVYDEVTHSNIGSETIINRIDTDIEVKSMSSRNSAIRDVYVCNGSYYLKRDLEPIETCNDITEDIVNRPNHYKHGDIEVIDYISAVTSSIEDGYEGYLVGNILKYVSRYMKKNGVEDLKKAEYYLKDLIERLDK